MKRMITAVIIILLSMNMIFAEQTIKTNVEQYKIKDESKNIKEVREYLKKRQEKIEKEKKKKKPESSLRRFGVQFFSSGAMAYLSTWILSRLFSMVTTRNSSELPDTYWIFIITNSAGMATYIAVKDYYDVQLIRGNQEDRYSNRNQNFYRLSLLSSRF